MLELSNWLPGENEEEVSATLLPSLGSVSGILGIPSTCLAAGQEKSGDKLRNGETGWGNHSSGKVLGENSIEKLHKPFRPFAVCSSQT